MVMTILKSVAVISGIALVAGVVLAVARRKLPSDKSGLTEEINRMLPQTQCAQCGYPGCRPYAAAIAESNAPINLCPPGGQDTVDRLAALLGKERIPLAEDAAPADPQIALIDEALCIGCAHCLSACPVDAIVGAPHFMHTVIVEECTGCELCIAPCPVDCIRLEPAA